MRTAPARHAAALVLASAGALAAQPPAAPPADTAGRDASRRDSVRRDTVVREYTIRRFGPGDVTIARGPGAFEFFGPARDAVERRSAIGLWLGEADESGLRVARVTPDGPAARAGIAAGDRLVAVAGTSLRVDRADAGDPLLAQVPARRLERAVGRLAPGSEVELRVVHDGRERSVKARTVAPDAVADRWPAGPGDVGPGMVPFRIAPGPDVDLRFRGPANDSALTELRRRARAAADSARTRAAARPVLGLTLDGGPSGRDTLGIFVSGVASGGPAERAGIVEGDRIAGINSVDLRVPREERDDPRAADARRARFTRELERLRPGDRVSLRVWGDGRWRTVAATVARASEVYRGGGSGMWFGFGPGVPGDAFAPDPDQFPRMLPRIAPLPGVAAPRFRLDGPAAYRLRAPVAPVAPLPARAGRRLVRI